MRVEIGRVLIVEKSEGTFLYNVLRFWKEHCSSEGSRDSPVCTFSKSNMSMKISMGHHVEHWWNDIERDNKID